MSTISAPASFSQAMPFCQSASISSGMPSTRYSFGMPTFMPLNRLADRRLVVGHGAVDRCRVLRIDRGHGFQHDRRIAHVARDRPGLVERRGKGDDAPARAAAVGRLDADRAGEGGRLADRAAGVGRGRAGAKECGDGRSRAARRAARHELRIVKRACPCGHRRWRRSRHRPYASSA